MNSRPWALVRQRPRPKWDEPVLEVVRRYRTRDEARAAKTGDLRVWWWP